MMSPDIARLKSAAGRNPVDRDHDRHTTLAQRAKCRPIVAHHAGGNVGPKSIRCLEILSGTKPAPFPCQHQRSHARVIRHLADGRGEPAEQIGRHGIEARRLTERQKTDGAIFRFLHTGHFHLLMEVLIAPNVLFFARYANSTRPSSKQQANTMCDQFSP